MIKQINVCAIKSLPPCSTEHILSKENYVNTRFFNTKRTRILASKEISADVSGAVLSGENCFMGFNVSPNIFVSGCNYMSETLEESLRKILNMGKTLQGFICGGLSDTVDAKSAAASYALYNEIAEVFDKLGIPFGMICGKENAKTFDNMKIHKEKIYMWGDYLQDCFTQETKKPLNRDNISDFYKDVIMPENIEFELIRDIK